jgi:Flp pilus assembly protein TadG
MPDVKIPGIGEVPRGAVIGGVAVVVGLVVVYAYRQKSAAATAAANTATPATTMVTDPAGNQCVTVDPASGYCPGTEEDEQYQEQEASSVGDAYDEYDTGEDLITDADGNQCVALDPSTGLCPASESTTGTATGTYTTNAQWVQAAEQQLGVTSTVQAALGYVLSGAPVTAAQVQIFQEAVGLIGPPPQGYPPPNVTTPSTQSSPAPAGATVTVPSVSGKRLYTQAVPSLTSAGLGYHVNISTSSAHEYTVLGQTPGAGTKVAKGTVVDLDVSQIKGT